LGEWIKIPIEEMAARSGSTVYPVQKEISVCKDGKVPLVFTHPKREMRKQRVIFDIIRNLPCTLLVLNKRTGYNETDLKRYLDKLVFVNAIIKEWDMYFLDINWISEKHDIKNRFVEVWDRWVSFLPEYATPTINDPHPKGSAVKLVLRGQKIDPTNRVKSEQKAIKRYKKKKSS
jgi:hypothetical protein